MRIRHLRMGVVYLCVSGNVWHPIMTRYVRNIKPTIIFLRILLIAGFLAIFYLVFIGSTLSTVSILIVLLALGLIEVRKLTLNNGAILIDRLSWYGFVHKQIKIDEHSTTKFELFVNGDIEQVPDSDSPFGTIVFLIPFLYKKYALWLKNVEGKTIIIMKLTKKEFSLIDEAR